MAASKVSCWAWVLLLLSGMPLAGTGTWVWKSAAIEPTTGVVERQWELPDGSGLGVVCTTQLRMRVRGDAAASDELPSGVSANVTVAGPCIGVPDGRVVPLCQPLGRPDRVVVECEMSSAAALWIMAVGWAIVGTSASALVTTFCLSGRGRGGGDRVELAPAGSPGSPRGPGGGGVAWTGAVLLGSSVSQGSHGMYAPGTGTGTGTGTGRVADVADDDGTREFRREDSDSLLLPVNIGVPLTPTRALSIIRV